MDGALGARRGALAAQRSQRSSTPSSSAPIGRSPVSLRATSETHLAGLGEVGAINLRINSPGGDVFDGIAIHNMLARHKAKVVVTVDGLAASIASLIAMAGDLVIMPENATMFVHNPFGFVVGDADDMAEEADWLRKLSNSMAATYARKTGKTPEEMLAVMNARTWMTAQEARDQGFADKVTARRRSWRDSTFRVFAMHRGLLRAPPMRRGLSPARAQYRGSERSSASMQGSADDDEVLTPWPIAYGSAGGRLVHGPPMPS